MGMMIRRDIFEDLAVSKRAGVRWLTRALYSAEFPEDRRLVVREFAQRVYHRTSTEAQLDALLATGRA